MWPSFVSRLRRAALVGVVVAVCLGGTIPSARAVHYAEVYRQRPFLMSMLLQVLPVQLGGPQTDLIVLGRDYEAREVRLHALRWTGSGFSLLWSSDNLFQWASPVAVAAGDFRGRGESEVVAVTPSTIRLFAWDGERFRLVEERPNPVGEGWEAVSWRPDRDRPHQLGVTRIRTHVDFRPEKELVWLTWRADGWRRRSPSLPVGNLRSVAAADLTGDGREEVVTEHGDGTKKGIVTVWRYEGGRWLPMGRQVLRPAAIFALGAGESGLSSGAWVVAGDNHGRVTLYEWAGDALRATGEPVPIGWGLTAAALADVTGDGLAEAVVLGYPDRLHVLAPSP